MSVSGRPVWASDESCVAMLGLVLEFPALAPPLAPVRYRPASHEVYCAFCHCSRSARSNASVHTHEFAREHGLEQCGAMRAALAHGLAAITGHNYKDFDAIENEAMRGLATVHVETAVATFHALVSERTRRARAMNPTGRNERSDPP